MRHSMRVCMAVLTIAMFVITASAEAQTFRGGISGRVVDDSGGVLPGVTITATNVGTGLVRTTVSSSTGVFTFPDLPLGSYTVEAAIEGFQPQRATVEVSVSKTSTADFKMGLSQLTEVVNVSAAAVTLDMQSTALANVIQPKQVQELPLNGRDFRGMLQLAPGVAGTSVNGVRTRGNNFQIDGADNNDAFQNTAAVNQGGVSGIAGTLLPIEAIDQFSVQSGGQAETGRNAGSTVNLVIKSGTNALHGSAYYFNRNENLAANSPVAAPGTPKRPIRNNQYGFSTGGPIKKNKAFFFTTLEIQKLTAGNTIPTTAPSDAWVASAAQLMSQFGVPVNPVAVNLLALWPQASRTGPATAQNFVSTDNNTYDSANGIVKVDQQFNEKYGLSTRYFFGGGDQVATTNSPYLAYFQAVPSRMHNVSLVSTSVLTSHLVNQLVVGYNYFKQTFNSYDTSANPIAMGFNTGVTDPDLAGPPNITINGFAAVGGTQPLGRVDKTLHFTNSLSYAKGAHQFKFGGEFRLADLNIFYDSNKRGTFTYDGTVGPWASLPASQASASLKSLADFMAGSYVTGIIVQGNTHHDYFQNSGDLFFQDVWSATSNLTINFGARYTIPGVLGASDAKLTNFLPEKGMVSTDSLYPSIKDAISPRVGFAWVPMASRKTVIRGGYGLFYDMFAVAFFTANTGFANGGALGVGNNPGGETPVYSITQRRQTVTANVPIFGTTPVPPYGAFGVSQDLQLPYVVNFNVNVEQQLGPSTILQVGYVGTRGHRLALMRDVNQPTPGASLSQARRPVRDAVSGARCHQRARIDWPLRIQLAADVADPEPVARPVGPPELHLGARDGQRLRGAEHPAAQFVRHRSRLGQCGVRHPPRRDGRVHLQHSRVRLGTARRRLADQHDRDAAERIALHHHDRNRQQRHRRAAGSTQPGQRSLRRHRPAVHAAIAPVFQPRGVRGAGGRHLRDPGAQRAVWPRVQDHRPVALQDDEAERRHLAPAAL